MSRIADSIPRMAARAFELLKEGVFELDADFKVVFVNQYAATLAGFSDPESLVAAGLRSVDLYVDQADHERVHQRLHEVGEVDSYVCQLKDLRGIRRWIELAVRVSRDDRDRFVGYWGVFRDLTPRLEAEQARDRLHGELIEALQRLEERNRNLREFSAALTHDLRSPLVALKGFAEIIESKHGECLGADGSRMLGRIRHNAMQMDQIICGIQDLVLMDSTREARVWLEPAQILANVENNRIERVRALGLTLEVQPGLPRLRVHPTRLFQLLDNLFSNALRAVEGRPGSHIWFGCGPPCAEQAFFIEDDGPGLSPELRERVFEPFFRDDRSCPGAGIGLTIARRVMSSYGGRIWAEVGRSGGARFCFLFGSDCQETADQG